MNQKIKDGISLLPDKPGCYLMHDINDEIIYVGKAKNLKNRVSQYFLRVHDGKTGAMVSHVDHFEFIITKSEKEAFILEENLIQKYYPRYNILLKDDKHYPYISIHKCKDPYISISRNMNDKKCDYYGPFPQSSSAYEMVDILNTFYPLRKCKNVPKSPCLYYQLGQCLAPCINKITNDEYESILKDITSFLKGDNKKLIQLIKEKISEKSINLEFEDAQIYKRMLDSIDHINDKQTVEFKDKKDSDVFSYYVNEGYISIACLTLRNGMLIGKRNFVYELIDEPLDFLVSYLIQYYKFNKLPAQIVIGNLEIVDILKDVLNAEVISPSRGKFYTLISTAQENAKKGLEEHFLSLKRDENLVNILENFANLLKIKYPKRIELFDNSHLQGSDAIGAMVCFINGEPNKKLYRKFNIESYNKKDDLSSMKEVIKRRYQRVKNENQEFPDLIVLDGGIEQIKACEIVLKEIDVNIPFVGLKKNEHHRTSSLVLSDGSELDLKDHKDIFLFLTRMQDEVHRYAISSHAKKRNKSMFKGFYDDIKGLGERRIELLNKTYPTLEELSSASVDELSQIIPKEIAYKIKEKIEKIKL